MATKRGGYRPGAGRPSDTGRLSAAGYEIRRLDQRLLKLETALSSLVHDKMTSFGQDRAKSLRAEIAAASARLRELLGE